MLLSPAVEARDFPGYYVTLTKDTVKCDFQFKDWEVTPDFVTVRSGNTASKLYPADILAFGIYGYGNYKTYDISYHKGNYISLDAPDTFSDSITRKHSFVKMLVTGKYSLYELTESSHAYYFYTVNDSAISELKYRIKRVGMNLKTDDTYKKTITELFAAEASAQLNNNKITKIAYSSRDIVPLFRTLNEQVSGEKTVRKKRKLTQFDLFIGGLSHQFPTAVDGMYSGRLNEFDGTQSITGGLNFQWFVPANFRRLAVGASLAYSKYKAETSGTDSIKFYGSINNYRNTGYTENFKLNNTVLMLDIYSQYIFNPLNKVNVYAKGGIVTNFAIGGSQNILVNYNSSTTGVSTGVPVSYEQSGVKTIEMRKTYYNVHAGLGLIAGSHKLEYTYYTPGILNGAYGFKMKMMGVHYYYTIIKKG
jgi:hypothetical protein